MYDCNLDNVKKADLIDGYDGGACRFTNEQCNPESNFNFLDLYYCDFDHAFGKTGMVIAFVPIGLLFVFIAMYNLASTADIYLSPSLETITTKFGCSDSLAGVTLLAFGNGAPDVFSAIAAANSSNPGQVANATKSVSVIIGGTFFITCVVVVLSTRASTGDSSGTPPKQIQVTPRFFIRDVSFFMISCTYLLIILLTQKHFNIYTSVGLLLIYACYVIMVVVQSEKRAVDLDDEQLKANLFNEMIKE